MFAACSTGNDSPVGTKQAQLPLENAQRWRVELNISGGFAGIRRQITVNADGSLIATDGRQGSKVERTLQTEQLAKLNTVVAALESAPTAQSGRAFPGRCADCIQSRLNATVNGKTYTATVRSGEKPAQPFDDLIAQLAQLLQETLSQQ